MNDRSEGILWKTGKSSARTPLAANMGPNQILLLENQYFRNGYIEAVVQPVALQPHLEPTKKPKMECGLLGRYEDPDHYIAGGLGVHGEDFGITRFDGGHFERLDVDGGTFGRTNFNPKGHQFRMRLTFKDNEVTLSCDDFVCHGKTKSSRGGRCGLRADWTEAHFKDIDPFNEDKACLVIGPIGAVNSATRERSDRLLRELICPALAAEGYNAQRPDQFNMNHGAINDDIFGHLIEDELVIADLSEHNPNVYYELAIRHAVHKPFIHIIQGGDRLPFDVQNMRIIRVDLGSEESIKKARRDLEGIVSSLRSHPDQVGTTPVPRRWKLMADRRSKRP
jgi:hypothetical protein